MALVFRNLAKTAVSGYWLGLGIVVQIVPVEANANAQTVQELLSYSDMCMTMMKQWFTVLLFKFGILKLQHIAVFLNRALHTIVKTG